MLTEKERAARAKHAEAQARYRLKNKPKITAKQAENRAANSGELTCKYRLNMPKHCIKGGGGLHPLVHGKTELAE
jgi:hypothetical protein